MSDDALIHSRAMAAVTWPRDAAAERQRARTVALTALAVFAAAAAFYASLLFPGLGGVLNPGDSAKFQILGHTPILVHGPGYPLVLAIGALVRALPLPLPPWWLLTFVLSALPGAAAVTFAFLITERVTRSVGFGLAAALLLGTAGLVAVQATEAEVYALALAFLLGTVFLLIRFVETRRPAWFLVACGVYAVSFGNHLMMIMLVPLFLWTVLVHRELLQRRYVAAVAALILLGASQYLYLAYVAYDPRTSYSEYMPLPPEPMELVHYVLGTYFSDLYGSGFESSRNAEALLGTLRVAHPWLSLPLIVAGLALTAAGWRRRDAHWTALAMIAAAGLCFVPFVLWYGAYDIHAFHGPVLGPLLIVGVASLGWWTRHSPRLGGAVLVLLLLVGAARTLQIGALLGARAPIYDDVPAAVTEMVAQAPVERPIVAMSYGLRMATLYHELRGELPVGPRYRVHWRAIATAMHGAPVGGIVVPSDGYQFVRWIEHRRPELECRTGKVRRQIPTPWPAYTFECSPGWSVGAASGREDLSSRSEAAPTVNVRAPRPQSR
ncbi:MAG TPA: DUF2723 domain-containing protein [Pseudomonadales bacterium]